MTPFEPTMDAAFREYAELELRCHHLLAEEKENACEILEAEDRMEDLWTKLDDIQRRCLKGMGSDLHWVRRKGEPPPNGRKLAEEVTSAEQQELAEAIESQQWHKMLHDLRLCAPMIRADSLANLRGRAYEAVGLPTYASVFYEHAAELRGVQPGSGEERNPHPVPG